MSCLPFLTYLGVGVGRFEPSAVDLWRGGRGGSHLGEAMTVPTFTDMTGCTWRVEFTRELIEAVKLRTTARIDLARAVQSRSGIERAFPSSTDGLQRVAEVLFIVCESQITAEGLSPESFVRLIAPPTFEPALYALFAAIARFYPSSPFGVTHRRTTAHNFN